MLQSYIEQGTKQSQEVEGERDLGGIEEREGKTEPNNNHQQYHQRNCQKESQRQDGFGWD